MIKRDSSKKSIGKMMGSAAKTVKKSAKAALVTGRTTSKQVELEPHPLETSTLRSLHKERRRLLAELTHQEMLTQDHPTSGNHMADDATEVEEQTKSFALRRHLEGILQEIDRAIARAEKGTYGVCERCNHSIAEERLKAMPSATLCIDCAKLSAHPAKVPLE